MKKNWKKVLALVLAAVIMTSIMAACAPKEDGGKKEAEIKDGKFVETVTISQGVRADAATKFNEGDNYDENVWTRLIEERLGVKLTVEWSADGATDAYGNKLNMSIANKELPDIFSCYFGTYSEAAESGLLTDMTPYIEQYGSEALKKAFADNAELVDGCKVNGKLYCIPNLPTSYQVNSNFLWIRQDWLDAVGMKAPTTWDELLEVARAFVTKDPDGNGADDTVGLGLAGASPWWGGIGCFDGIAEAFHAVTLQNWVKDENGRLVYGSTQPQMKTALQAAADMYKEGLLDPEFMTKGTDEVVADIYNNKIGMTFGANYAGYWPLLDVVKQNNDAVWKPYPFVSADGEPAKTATWWPMQDYTCVAASCENPAAAVLIANLYLEIMSSDDKAIIEKYNYSGDTNNYMLCPVRLNAGCDEFKTVEAWKAIEAGTAKLEDFTGIVRANLDHINGYVNDGNVDDYGYWSQLGEGGAMQIVLEDYIPGGRIALTEIHGGFPTEVSAEMGLIQDKEIQYINKIVSGTLPVDAFEDWLKDFTALGGDKVTEVVNETFG